jgi:15-cis-phytoene synthase
MVDRTLYRIFKAGSRTYFYSSLFFPQKLRDDVFILYSFVRKADDLVDSVPQQNKEFYSLKERYRRAMGGEKTGDIVVDSFASLVQRRDFEPVWVDSFLSSMEMDLYQSEYRNIRELDEYIYGSAEVIGLMMAKLMDLPKESYPYARLLGRSMQYMNFIRDISEDLRLGRTYFPQEDFQRYGLSGLEPSSVTERAESFRSFVRTQLSYYDLWQSEAEDGFKYIPKRYLIPIKTASEMYKWTAEQIREDPFIVYAKKVKPSIPRIVFRVGYNALPL